MTNPRLLILCSPMLLAPTCGGPATFSSEEEQWRFEDTGLVAGLSPGLGDDQSVLPGTEVCPREPDWRGEDVEGWRDEDLLAACVAQELTGPASFSVEGAAPCIAMEAPGEVDWLLVPVACDAPFPEGGEPAADSVRFSVADPAAVTSHVYQWPELSILNGGDEIEPPGGFTEDDLLEVGETFYVLGDQPVRLYVQLWDSDRAQPVAWPLGEGRAVVEEHVGRAMLEEELVEGGIDGGWIGLSLVEGSEVELGIRVGDEAFYGAAVQTVPASELASLTLVASYDDFSLSDLEPGRFPSRARAILRDGAGHQVFGAPVAWRVTGGRLAVRPGMAEADGELPGDDYAILSDACRRPSRLVGEHSVTLHASYGDLSDRLELTWNYPERWLDDVTREELKAWDDNFEPDPWCTGCGCSGRGAAGRGALLLAPLGLLMGMRCRRPVQHSQT
ncbi:MAG: hypothetical protein ABIO70_17170 [Pseudomonadota bacterium]